MTVQPDEVGVETDEPEDEVSEDEQDNDQDKQDKDADKPAGGANNKAVAEVKVERERRRKAEDELRRLKSESATEGEKAIAAAVEQADQKWAGRFKTMASRLALSEAGVPADRLARAARLLDLDVLDVDEQGSVTGLDSEVDALKDQWPDLFEDTAKSNGTTTPRVRAPGAQGAGPQKKSSAQRLADQLLGKQ